VSAGYLPVSGMSLESVGPATSVVPALLFESYAKVLLNTFSFLLTRHRVLAHSVFEHVHLSIKRRLIMYVIGCYVSYLAICLAVTIWVARTLHKNGRVFLADAFHGDTELADSVNHLLVVGFYLINIGYVALVLRATETLSTLRGAIELVSDKVGLVLLVLGFMHFFNLFVFSRIRKRSRSGASPGLQVPRATPQAQQP